MKKSTSTLGRFARLLPDVSPSSSFLRICRNLRVHPDDLDEILYSELGYTGDELLSEICRGKS